MAANSAEKFVMLLNIVAIFSAGKIIGRSPAKNNPGSSIAGTPRKIKIQILLFVSKSVQFQLKSFIMFKI